MKFNGFLATARAGAIARTALAGSVLGAAVSVQAACPTGPTASRFTFNGAEVTDTLTGLVWARCSVGQTWTGSTCNGTASTYTHQAALQYAASQSGWRLPSRQELSSLADKGCQNPAIDATAFPNTPGIGFWTWSPYVGNRSSAWYVGFVDGNVSYDLHSNSNAVRLVRASQ